MDEVYKRLKDAKTKSGKSYTDIAEEVGGSTDASGVANIFSGKRSASLKTLSKIFEAIKGDPEDIGILYLTMERKRLEARLARLNAELSECNKLRKNKK